MVDWMKQLNKMDGATDKAYNPFAVNNVLRSTSPSLNWTFSKGFGLPFGQSLIVFGPPKAGKSLIANLFVAGLHAQDPTAIAVKFNTEMRESAQGDMSLWGYDDNRYQGYDVNNPGDIFDRITNEFVPLLEAGMPLKLLIIDSMEGVEGVKSANKESILKHTIGDHALTIGEGLKRILPIIRKYKIAVICTSHIRANIGAVGKMAPKTKMAGGFAQKHWFEYYMEVKRDGGADSKKSITGEKFDTGVKDFKDNKELTGHKIWCKMKESSVGVAGRTGQFTLDYTNGIVNTHEEIFFLAKNLGIAERPNNTTYVYEDVKYVGKQKFAEAIRDDKDMAKRIMDQVYAQGES